MYPFLQALSGEMGPFLCSGSHQAQRDCQPSALNCFVEAMSQCVPPIPIRPCVLKYLGKTHNLWLRSTLMLEQQAFEKGLSLHIKPKQSTEFYEQESITPPQQVQWYMSPSFVFVAIDILGRGSFVFWRFPGVTQNELVCWISNWLCFDLSVSSVWSIPAFKLLMLSSHLIGTPLNMDVFVPYILWRCVLVFPQEILDSLAELYSLLQEEDMWAGLWQKRCKFPETSTSIAYEQHGFFEQVRYWKDCIAMHVFGKIWMNKSKRRPAHLIKSWYGLVSVNIKLQKAVQISCYYTL